MSHLKISNNLMALSKASILLFILILLYFPFLVRLVNAWDIKPHASHGYFIIPVIIWLIWQQKDTWNKLEIQPSPIAGVSLITCGLALYLLGVAISIDTFISISLMLNIAAIVFICMGKKTLKKYWFPYFFLLFMFPIPDALYVSLTVPLKLIASEISAELIRFTGQPVFLDGNIIEILNFKMEVVEACSGLQSLMTYFMIGLLLAMQLNNTIPRSLLLITMIIPVAMLANILRITATGVLAGYFGTEIAHGFFHEIGGILTFIVGLVILFGLFSLLSNSIKK